MVKKSKAKIRMGPRGGKYRLVNGKKKYLTKKLKKSIKRTATKKKKGDGVMMKLVKNQEIVLSSFKTLLAREKNTPGIAAKYRRMMAGTSYAFPDSWSDSDVIRWWGESLRALVGPFSASPSAERTFNKKMLALTAGERGNDEKIEKALIAALAPADRKLYHQAIQE